MNLGGKGYRSDWWSKKLRKKFLMWASYFIVGLYLLTLAVFIVLSLSFSQAADTSHIAFLKEFILNFSSPVILLAILFVLWSREV